MCVSAVEIVVEILGHINSAYKIDIESRFDLTALNIRVWQPVFSAPATVFFSSRVFFAAQMTMTLVNSNLTLTTMHCSSAGGPVACHNDTQCHEHLSENSLYIPTYIHT